LIPIGFETNGFLSLLPFAGVSLGVGGTFVGSVGFSVIAWSVLVVRGLGGILLFLCLGDGWGTLGPFFWNWRFLLFLKLGDLAAEFVGTFSNLIGDKSS
jgi:hypothetical protein